MSRPNAAEKVAIAKRRGDAIELRLAGLDMVSIGRKLAADPSANLDGLEYPLGYGNARYKEGKQPPTDDQFTALVAEDIARALKERYDAGSENVADLRAIEAHRLDRLFLVVWRQALQGDLGAVDRALRIQERRARLLGLDEATILRHTGADGGAVKIDVDSLDAKIDALIATAGSPAGDEPVDDSVD